MGLRATVGNCSSGRIRQLFYLSYSHQTRLIVLTTYSGCSCNWLNSSSPVCQARIQVAVTRAIRLGGNGMIMLLF